MFILSRKNNNSKIISLIGSNFKRNSIILLKYLYKSKSICLILYAFNPILLDSIYFKEFSGIAYLHVWNSIEDRTFKSRFSRIVREKFDDFFVDCAIEPISDIKTFAEKILGLTAITDIRAKVSPPNPLFGRCWKSLNDYINGDTYFNFNIQKEA